VKEPEGDWYEAWTSLTLPGATWRDRRRALACLVLGHREVVSIPHREVCERPWDKKHTDRFDGQIDRICRHCDSGWLRSTIEEGL
jgi:hypothetical protein